MHVTNTTPQMQAFNAPIWLALEDYALGHAKEDEMKISEETVMEVTSGRRVLTGALKQVGPPLDAKLVGAWPWCSAAYKWNAIIQLLV